MAKKSDKKVKKEKPIDSVAVYVARKKKEAKAEKVEGNDDCGCE